MEKDKDKKLQEHIDGCIEYLKGKQNPYDDSNKINKKPKNDSEFTRNQRRFEYDYEEDFYEPDYEDEYH